MFFGSDEAELRKLREKAYREQLVAGIRDKQQKPVASEPQQKQEQQSYFMQQSQREQQERQQKRDKYLQELKLQQQSEAKLKEERKRQEKQQDRLLEEKIKRDMEMLRKRQLQEIEKEKNKERKGYQPPAEEAEPPKKRPPLRPSQQTVVAEEQQPPNHTPRKQVEFKPTFSHEVVDNPQPTKPQLQPQQNYFTVDQRPKYRQAYNEDLRRVKNTLQEQAYRMGQLKQKIQSSSRTTIETNKYNSSLTELQNLNKLLQEKHQNYYRLPIMDSLDREMAVHSRDKGRQDSHEQEYSSFYEFKL